MGWRVFCLVVYGERNVQGRRRQFAMGNSVRNYSDCQLLGVVDGFVSRLAVTHRSWQLKGFRDPTTIFFPIKVNR